MRKDITFRTRDGLTLRGWHHVPDGLAGKAPVIVVAPGFSAVKDTNHISGVLKTVGMLLCPMGGVHSQSRPTDPALASA